jgi:hypothetical protein
MRILGVLLVLVVSAASALHAQSAPRYGDLTRDGVITGADTIALRRLLAADSSSIDSTYRVRPDTLDMVSNVWPVNLPGLGERTDARAPGWELPRWKMRVDQNDLSALRRYLRGAQRSDQTIVGQLIPEWRLSGGLNLESGDVQYLGYRVRAKLGPGSYRVFATRRYPDSSYRQLPPGTAPDYLSSLGSGFMNPFWLGLANNTSPNWPAASFHSAAPLVYVQSSQGIPSDLAAAPGVVDFVREILTGVPMRYRATPATAELRAALPPGASYPGCAAFPNALGDTITLWTNPNTNGNFTTTFNVARNFGVQRRFEVLGYTPRVMIMSDSLTAAVLFDILGRDSTIKTFSRQARKVFEALGQLREYNVPILPTSSINTATQRVNSPGAPLIAFYTLFPLGSGRSAAALGATFERMRDDCAFVGRTYWVRTISSASEMIAEIYSPRVDEISVHEIGHIAQSHYQYATGGYGLSSGMAEGLANLYAYRYQNLDIPISRMWEKSFSATRALSEFTGNADCFATVSSYASNVNQSGAAYAPACQLIASTVSTAVQRRRLSASDAWSRLDYNGGSFDVASRRIMGLPLGDWFPQVVASTYTQGRFALRQGSPWQLAMKMPPTGADTLNLASVSVGTQVKVRMDSTRAGHMLRLVSVPDSAILRIFTRDSTIGATSVQLNNLALTIVRE